MKIWNNQLHCVDSAYGLFPLASPGGKLLSEARLMRGGDRLVYECS